MSETTERRTILYAAKRHSDRIGEWYTHVYKTAFQVRLCSVAEVRRILVRDLRPGETSMYWAWWSANDREFRYVWPSNMQVDICFPSGTDLLVARGEGEVVNVAVDDLGVVDGAKAT